MSAARDDDGLDDPIRSGHIKSRAHVKISPNDSRDLSDNDQE